MSAAMRRAVLPVLLVCACLAAAPASADVLDYVGRPIATVRIEIDGAVVDDPSVRELIETRVGDPLSMQRVRESIDHLVGLGRFEDVRIFASDAGTADAVALRWALTPVRRLVDVEITGQPAVGAGRIRREIDDLYGATPSSARVPAIVGTLSTFYAERGYRGATIVPRVVPGGSPEDAHLVLDITAGPRTRLSAVNIEGTVPAGVPQARLGLAAGDAYDRAVVDERVAAFEDALRQAGYYEASVEPTVTFDGVSARLDVAVDAGPHVEVVITGDPLPAGRLETLVPIRAERSVDQDLLEDASRNIERALRQEGYRDASAPYTREEQRGELVLTFTVTRGPLHRVERVEVEGQSQLGMEDIRGLLRLEAGEPFVDARVSAVASAITELYRVRGFTAASVQPRIAVLPEAGGAGNTYRPVAITLAIEEGQPTTVRAMTVEGVSPARDADVRALLDLTAGRPFYRPLVNADEQAIRQYYRNDGFQQVSVSAAVEPAGEGAVDVHWTVQEGPQTLVDHILVTGNDRTSADLIRREVTLRPGEPLGEDALAESQRRLSALGLFRRVRLAELPHGASTNRDVVITVEEAPATTISYGGGVEAGRRYRPDQDTDQASERFEIAPRVFFEIGRRNLWGKNRAINLFTRISLRPRDPGVDEPDTTDTGGYGFNEYRVIGTYREPRAFGTTGDAQVTAFVEQAIRTSFNFRRRGLRGEYSRRFDNGLTAIARYSVERTRLFDEKIAPEERVLVDRLFPQVRLSTVTGSVLRDSRNDVLDPERGAVLGFDVTTGPRWLGSEVGFVKSYMQASTYRRLPGGSRFVLAASARVGLAKGFPREVTILDEDGVAVPGPDGQPQVEVVEDLPASERFFAGGDTTVRGFVLDRLGTDETLNRQGFPAGGNGLVVLNLELRAPYWKGLGLVGFLDAGNVFARAGDIRLGELRTAAGFGVRYRSPIGPLRIDLGFNLDPRMLSNGDRERGSVLHISLGQAF
ncbi:MAG: POTRA domain-containing protein [Vicinamibacterales bacterium]